MGQDPRQFEAAPSYVIFFDFWREDLVYHQPGWTARPEYTEITRCGRPIGRYRPWLPKKLGPKIGRPCKGCFPGGDHVRG